MALVGKFGDIAWVWASVRDKVKVLDLVYRCSFGVP